MICSPTDAFFPMESDTRSSNAWYAGSEPIEQVGPLREGQSPNVGACIPLPAVYTVAVTRRDGTVLHIQTE